MNKTRNIIVATVAILAVTGLNGLQARENNRNDQALQTISNDGKVSKSDARKIMKAYLKEKKVAKKLRVGEVRKIRNTWKVKVTSNKITVLTGYVDDKTGEITFKR